MQRTAPKIFTIWPLRGWFADTECFHHSLVFPAAPLQDSPPPHPLATTDLLSITVVLPFLEFHINEITQYVAFCVWLLSLTMLLRFILWGFACVSSGVLFYF